MKTQKVNFQIYNVVVLNTFKQLPIIIIIIFSIASNIRFLLTSLFNILISVFKEVMSLRATKFYTYYSTINIFILCVKIRFFPQHFFFILKFIKLKNAIYSFKHYNILRNY